MQALNIPTKINRGTVEIVSDVHLIKATEKVGGSEATLLSKLGIKPFSYGLVLLKVCHCRSHLTLAHPYLILLYRRTGANLSVSLDTGYILEASSVKIAA